MPLRLFVLPILFIVGFLLSTPLVSLADGPNLILNSSFETGTNNPTGWAKGRWGANSSTFSYPATGIEGAKAAKVTVSNYVSGDAKWDFISVPVTVGKVYSFSNYSLSNVPTTLEARYRLSNGTYKYVLLGSVSGTNAWQKFVATTTPPATATSVSVYHYINRNGSLTVDAYDFHEVVPTTTPPVAPPPPPVEPPAATSTNLIPNPSMETVSPFNASLPDKWQQGGWGTNTKAYSYPVSGVEGVKAAKVSMSAYTSGDAKWYFNPVPIIPNKEYTFSNKYLSSVGTSITARYQMSDGTFVYSFLGNVAASNSWTTFTKKIIPPAGSVNVTVFHVLAAVGSLTVDAYSIQASTVASNTPEPMVTLVFDDGLSSQYEKAVPILDAAGIKATFAIITNRVGTSSRYMTWQNIKTLNATGHDIGGHTRNHLSLITLSESEAQYEIKGSFDDLVAQGLTPSSFAYPFGDENAAVQQVVKTSGFLGARGVVRGFNDKNSNRYALNDQHIESDVTVEQVKIFIDEAIANKKWLIFELHNQEDVTTNQYSNTPTTLQGIVNYIKSKGIRVVTLTQGLQLIGQ